MGQRATAVSQATVAVAVAVDWLHFARYLRAHFGLAFFPLLATLFQFVLRRKLVGTVLRAKRAKETECGRGRLPVSCSHSSSRLPSRGTQHHHPSMLDLTSPALLKLMSWQKSDFNLQIRDIEGPSMHSRACA